MKPTKFAEKVREFICANCIISPCWPILVALSGGADSVALLRVLLELGYDCAAAHCNFHLRGEESDRDEFFVRDLCARLGVELHVKHFDVPAYCAAHGVSVEMACRELRYGWFGELLKSDKYAELAVAHHRDDNIETIFLNMLRGTGVAGLSGMKARNGAVVRPLLCVTRKEVVNYLASITQDYVTDSTNLSDDYQRNKVRNLVLPVLDETFPQCRDRIADTIQNVAEFQAVFEEMAERFWADGKCTISGNVVTCDLSELMRMSQPKLLLHHLLSKYGFNMEQCGQLIDCEKRKKSHEKSHFFSKTHTLTFDGQFAVIEINTNKYDGEYIVNFNSLENLPVSLDVSVRSDAFESRCCDGKNVVAFDASLLRCGKVLLRRWRRGDRMRPFGMKGRSRLVSDLFSDAHLTLNQKKNVWLLEADGSVVWVLGMRASEDYKVTDASESYILLRFKPDGT